MQDVIIHQANCVFDVLEAMLKASPAKEINAGGNPAEVIGRQALHILGAFDKYSSHAFRWYGQYGKSYGLFGIKCDPAEIPAKKEILKYLKIVRKQFTLYVHKLPDGYLTKVISTRKEARCNTNLGKYIYLIRHNTLHLGYVRAVMDKRGFTLNEFK